MTRTDWAWLILALAVITAPLAILLAATIDDALDTLPMTNLHPHMTDTNDDDEPQCPAISPLGNRCDLTTPHSASHWHRDEIANLTDVWTDNDTAP